ncbi:MAG TPA: penicillin-binding protein 2 [Candidatus Saccharimonadales bacterium]|nr:penicillin-binding protein 2 [Candidatus Saccharimonadales bacterium]
MGPSSGQMMPIQAVRRTRWWYVFLLAVVGIFIIRLFYLQVIRYSYYHHTALSDQLKEYQIPAQRGTISAHEGASTIPLVLNEKLYTVYVDPTLVKQQDRERVADAVASVLGGNSSTYLKQLETKESRYQILGKRVSAAQKSKLLGYKFPGVGAQQQDYRTYPQGDLAAQVLGFVSDDGSGEYGVEQALNKQLAGTPGQLKAVTDINGVPLAANTGNILTEPTQGQNVTLTLDAGMQKQLQQVLSQDVKGDHAQSGSALIIDPNSGAIKAMANYPSYNPANYSDVSDASVFNNNAVASPLEVGSIMKPLTMAAALDQGVIQPGQTYYDPGRWTVDDFNITNIEEDGGAGTKSLEDILNLSLNTGATWMLMQMSQPGGTAINQKGRDAWHDYMVKHYQFGKLTGIEQGYEAGGTIPDPDNGYGRDLTYANTSFGQGMTATPLQMAAALSAVVNGGTYYKPYLVDTTTTPSGKTAITKPTAVKKDVVKPSVSSTIQSLMEGVVAGHFLHFPSQYIVGGKTGTAQIAKPGGGYYDNEFNGTYMGFVGGDKPQYVIVVSIIQPHNGGYAGTAAAQPVFASLANMLINDFNVTPKSH